MGFVWSIKPICFACIGFAWSGIWNCNLEISKSIFIAVIFTIIRHLLSPAKLVFSMHFVLQTERLCKNRCIYACIISHMDKEHSTHYKSVLVWLIIKRLAAYDTILCDLSRHFWRICQWPPFCKWNRRFWWFPVHKRVSYGKITSYYRNINGQIWSWYSKHALQKILGS